jgi:thioredoxin-related protein
MSSCARVRAPRWQRQLGALLLCWTLVATALSAPAERDPDQYFFATTFGDLRQDLDDARKEGKRGLLVVFEARDCPYCLRMHQTVLNRVDIQAEYRRHFTALRLAIDSSNAIVAPDGSATTESAYARRLGAFGTPFVVAIGADGRELGRMPGAPIDAAEFFMFKEYLLAGDSGARTFAQFKAQRRTGQ